MLKKEGAIFIGLIIVLGLSFFSSPTITGQEVREGNTYLLHVNSITIINGKRVELLNVESSGEAILRSDKQIQKIKPGQTKTLNGLKITNLDSMYNKDLAKRTVMIKAQATGKFTEFLSLLFQ
mgnify:CR=1 FL=1